MALTQRSIRDSHYNERSAATKQVLWDTKAAGLGVRVFKSGVKSFVVSYK